MPTPDEIVARITREDVVKLALEVCNIDSPPGLEGEVSEFVFQWMKREGFETRKVGLFSDRFNVLGKLPGSGGGYSLIFNSHVDTTVARQTNLVHIDATAAIYHSAWEEDGHLVGEGICNDKGPMAAFLVAAKAIKDSGLKLKGDLLISSVINEAGGEPCDEEPGVFQSSKDIGARFLATHGGIADFALIAEGTGFGLCWIEAGEGFLKIQLRSKKPAFYTPYLPDRTTPAESGNMIVAASAVVEAVENWATEYQKRTFSSAGGTVVPKAQFGAIRSGYPNHPIFSPQLCNLYLHIFMVPGQDPLALKDEISATITRLGIEHSIEYYSFRPGYEAKNIDRFANAVMRAHVATFGEKPKPPFVETSSMWRDLNVWNEIGIPAMTYGPRGVMHMYKRALTIESLYQAACVYARIAVEVCNEVKNPQPPAERR